MKLIIFLSSILSSVMLLSGSAQAATAQSAIKTAAQPADQDETDALKAAEQWLSEVDQGNFTQSWEHGSMVFKLTMPRGEWDKYLRTARKPLGRTISRVAQVIRPAEDPKGLPKGKYMVVVFKTEFEGRPNANELVTLFYETDKQWRPLTYNFK